MLSQSSPKAPPVSAWEAFALTVGAAISIGLGVWLPAALVKPVVPAPAPAKDELLIEALLDIVQSPEYQLKLIEQERAELEIERAAIASERALLAEDRRNDELEASFRNVGQVVAVRDGQSLIADGSTENIVEVSCIEVDEWYTARQRSRGLILEARNLASCTPGTYKGGDVIGKTGERDLGWTVFHPG